MASSVRWAVALLTVVLSSLGTVAQIIEFREIDGRKIQCMHTGLTSDPKDCGAKSYWYSYVFIGSISAIVHADKGEEKLEIIPEECLADPTDRARHGLGG